MMFNPFSQGWWKKEMHDMKEACISFWKAFASALVALIEQLQSACLFAAPCSFFSAVQKAKEEESMAAAPGVTA